MKYIKDMKLMLMKLCKASTKIKYNAIKLVETVKQYIYLLRD